MVGCVIHYENAQWVYLNPKTVKKVFNFYSFNAKAFGIYKLCVINIDNADLLVWSDAEVDFSIYKTLKECIEDHLKWKVVLVEKSDRGVELPKFKHPKGNVLYVIGSDYGKLEISNFSNVKIVSIPTKTDVPLWSHSALAIVLYDRMIKCR